MPAMSRRSSAAAVAVPISKPPSSRTRRRQALHQTLEHDETLPAVDERLVMPEARAEIINGKVYFVPPADEPHGSSHIDLGAVVRAHLAPGYSGALDMLTRTSKKNDFAPDGSVYPSERDPKTGGRQLEEIAFEIASKQSISMPTRKARELVKRGVRRVFCIVLKKQKVLEWSRETDSFQPLSDDFLIDDRCFVRPIPARALLDGAESDRTITEALRAREDSTLMAMLDEARDQGIEKGIEKGIEEGQLRAQRQTILRLLDTRGYVVDSQIRSRVDACSDRATLDRWILSAANGKPDDDLIPVSIVDPP
jgi:Putative restriction endonuclease